MWVLPFDRLSEACDSHWATRLQRNGRGGVALCRLHHAAFDRFFLAVRPDHIIEVRPDVLEEIDGPTLQHAIQGLHGQPIVLPRKLVEQPAPEFLSERYERFLEVATARRKIQLRQCMDIERRFHQEMVRIYREATEFGYYPNYFLRMVVDQGGLAAAKQLLSSGDPSSGFVRLWQEQRLDLSVEALVLREPWSALFTDAELTEARRRLEELGYDPGRSA